MKTEGNIKNTKLRMLILGDSFIVKQTSLYRRLLDELTPYGVAVLNLAQSGYGPFEYHLSIKTCKKEFNPDIVLLSYYVGNDFTETKLGQGNYTSKKGKIKNFLKAYITKIYTYCYLREKINLIFPYTFNYKEMEKVSGPIITNDAKNRKISPYLLEAGLKVPNYHLNNLLIQDKDDIKIWDVIKKLITEINIYSRKKNAELLIVIFPSSLQINKSHFGFFKSIGFNMDEKTLTTKKPQILLKELCSNLNIKCLDLLPYFKALNEDLYRANDTHLNEKGNLLAEKIIFDFLTKNTKIGELKTSLKAY